MRGVLSQQVFPFNRENGNALYGRALRWRGTKQNLITLFKIFTNRKPNVKEPSDEASNSHFGGILPGLRFGRRVRETAQHENEQRVPTVEA
jgi:hypothetical protein